jgi:hypothetical protein
MDGKQEKERKENEIFKERMTLIVKGGRPASPPPPVPSPDWAKQEVDWGRVLGINRELKAYGSWLRVGANGRIWHGYPERRI